MEEEVYKLLRAFNLEISKTELQSRIASHYSYPGLLSVKDSLDSLNIHTAIYEIEKKDLSMEAFPLIIHTKKNNGQLKYTANLAELSQQDITDWSGIIIRIDAKGSSIEESSNYKKEIDTHNKNVILSLIGFAILVASLSYAIHNANYFNVAFSLLSLAGLGISYLILQKELGVLNKIAEKLCGTKKETDCNTVIKSDASTFIWGLKWSDVGLIYFSSSVLLFSLSNFGNFTLSSVYLPLSLAAFPFIVYSVYYQWRVAKSWCRLCLIVVGILGLQAITSLTLAGQSYSVLKLLNPSLTSIGVFTLISYFWLVVIKPLTVKARSNQNQLLALRRFKLNPNTFVNSLINQKHLQIPPDTQHLELGNNNANIQLVVVCNPYCAPCGRAHNILHQMLHHSGDLISLKVIFSVDAEKKEDPKTKAVQLIYDTISINGGVQNKELVRKVLHTWYNNPNEDAFKNHFLKSPINKTGSSLVTQIETIKDNWMQQIEFTPTLLINGYMLPKEYTISEFSELFLPLVNEEALIHKLCNTELLV